MLWRGYTENRSFWLKSLWLSMRRYRQLITPILTGMKCMTERNITVLNTNAFEPVTTQTWTNGRHAVRCVKVIQETWDVKTFCFMAEQPVMFFFKPGQFVTLELMIEEQTVFRSYTISSSPSVPYSFSITVKQVPGGVVSNWLHANMREGMDLAVHGPVGQFNCIDYPLM